MSDDVELRILKLEARLAALEGAVEDIGSDGAAPPLRKAVVGGPGVRVRDGEAVAVVEADPGALDGGRVVMEVRVVPPDSGGDGGAFEALYGTLVGGAVVPDVWEEGDSIPEGSAAGDEKWTKVSDVVRESY